MGDASLRVASTEAVGLDSKNPGREMFFEFEVEKVTNDAKAEIDAAENQRRRSFEGWCEPVGYDARSGAARRERTSVDFAPAEGRRAVDLHVLCPATGTVRTRKSARNGGVAGDVAGTH